MAEYTIQNGELAITVSEHGAELRSVKDCKTGREFMWQADGAFWARTSPVLFPVVGNYRNKEFSYGGKKYSMGQHGFARDSEFSLKSKTDGELRFSLCDNDKTRQVYPFSFELEIGYKLQGRSVCVMWNVLNKSDEAMYFSIGAHPAFNCEIGKDSLWFEKCGGVLEAGVLNSSGTLSAQTKKIAITENTLLLTDELFAQDALIIANSGEQKIAIIDGHKNKIVQVEFSSPVYGIWSPAKKHAPFVCIEPWYGRADREDFCGTLSEREYGNTIQAGETFERKYKISF